MKLIQDTMGVYGAFLGQESNATSGIAIANLVEQGATTLAEINDNYNFGSQLLGELLLGYILEDMREQHNKAIVINRNDKRKRKTVVMNHVDEQGLLTNDLTRLRAHIALAHSANRCLQIAVGRANDDDHRAVAARGTNHRD